MERVLTLFQSTINDESPEDRRAAFVNDLAPILLSHWQKRSWFPKHEEAWGIDRANETAEYLFKKLLAIKNRGGSESSLKKNVSDLANHFESAIFFTPNVVSAIYSPHPAQFEALVREGGDRHCRLIRFAATHAIRRHAPGMRSFSLDSNELEDELWGNVMEEVVRCLSDTSARVWKKKIDEPLVFPKEGIRGSKRGTIERIALSKNHSRLAAFRSDCLLFVWDTKKKELIRSWDLNGLDSRVSFSGERPSVPHLYFSNTGSKIALETDEQRVYVFPLDDPDGEIGTYTENSKDDFLRDFGPPFIPNLAGIDTSGFQFQSKAGDRVNWPDYVKNIFDWTCDLKPNAIATASEQYREMPGWMRDAGFERAIFHIAKKRLIDLIRKHTHTNYSCWQCGSLGSSPTDTECRECGFDFTHCPAGCPIPPSEPLDSSNHWQCPHCGMASRTAESMVEVEIDERFTGSVDSGREWESRHDFERIVQVLDNVSVTHKRKQVSCRRLLELKAEGKTNEEIGIELGIPRGSVDYVWNQCKQQILSVYRES